MFPLFLLSGEIHKVGVNSFLKHLEQFSGEALSLREDFFNNGFQISGNDNLRFPSTFFFSPVFVKHSARALFILLF